MIQTFVDVCTYVYVTVDDVFQTSIQPQDRRPGPHSSFTDSELLTVTLVAELVGLDDERTTSPGRIMPSFPCCPTAHAPIAGRALSEAVNTVRRHVLACRFTRLPPDERPRLLDSLPVPVVGFHHALGHHRWSGWATYG